MIRPHMRNAGFILAGILSLFLAGIIPSQAAPRTWVPTTGINDWFNPANWDGGTSIPGAGDAVTIATAGAALLTNSPGVYFSSLTLSKTLIFSNWNTTLSATNITIQNGGTVTLPAAFTNSQMSNNVYFVCSNLTIDAGGNINVDLKGYSAGLVLGQSGNGPGGGGSGAGGGGSYGGVGGARSPIYGAPEAPIYPGSGGYTGDNTSKGGNGGGAVRIVASGNVLVNGTISANGGARNNYSGSSGSGGGIFITCATFSGTNGTISANGGLGHGGGGRIAIIYTNSLQALISVPSVACSACGGAYYNAGSYATAPWYAVYGDLGTLYFPDNRLLTTNIIHTGQWSVPGTTNLSFDSLTVSNVWIRFPSDGFRLVVTNALYVVGSLGRLELGGDRPWPVGYSQFLLNSTTGSSLICGGDLILTNGGSLVVYSSATNSVTPDYSGYVSVSGRMAVASNSWVYPCSHPTNGGSVLFRIRNLTVNSNGGFYATGLGFSGGDTNQSGYGPGGTVSAGNANGAGYGGRGGGSDNVYGMPYGSVSNPISPGSGGGYASENTCGFSGGGVIRLQVDEDITLYGSILADGIASGSRGGAGSGGGILLNCRSITGNGLVRARGGNIGYMAYNAGGGGRIAVIYNPAAQALAGPPAITFNASAYGTADIGTVWWPDTLCLAALIPHSGELRVPNWTNWNLASLVISNGWIRLPVDGFVLTVTNNMTIVGPGASLELGGGTLAYIDSQWFRYNNTNGPTLQCGGNLTLTNNASLRVFSSPSNSLARCGAQVNVSGDLILAGTNCWIYPMSHPTNGGSPIFRVQSLLISDTNSGVNANASGFVAGGASQHGYGPGSGNGGGGYGGVGGGASGIYGKTYGSSNAPVDPGSGGYGAIGHGGGLIYVVASKNMMIYGDLLANGVTAGANGNDAGAGGGIYLRCKKLIGSTTALFSANGGNMGNTGTKAGGGGRIAVWRILDESGYGVISAMANAGTGDGSPGNGTIVWGWTPPPGTVFVIH